MKLSKKIFWFVLIVAIAIVAFYRQTIFDFVRGKIYSPSEDVAAIKVHLDLAPKGEFLFYASMPELNTEEEFNENCKVYDESAAVLGCYTKQAIHIYHVKAKELDGILELTAAHELLHAVYERMSQGERDSLKKELEAVYAANKDLLADEINSYDSKEQLEEIYVRAGTEIKKLPEALEKHYAEIFKDQDKVVGFYEKYSGVFKSLEAEMKSLDTELKSLNTQIDAKSSEYESRLKALNSEIDDFNNCANTAGCFSSDWEFYAKRNELVTEQSEVEGIYNELDSLINQYNEDVEKYNNNVIRSKNLQNIINSHVRVEGL